MQSFKKANSCAQVVYTNFNSFNGENTKTQFFKRSRRNGFDPTLSGAFSQINFGHCTISIWTLWRDRKLASFTQFTLNCYRIDP